MTILSLTFAPSSAGAGVARLAASDGAAPTRLVGLAVPFGVPSGPSSDGYRYQFDAGPENSDDLLDVVNEHDNDAVVGRLDVPLADAGAGAGLAAVARIFATQAGRDLLELTAERVKTGFSISASFETFTEDDQGVRHVGPWAALHLGVVRHPAFTQASGLTLAASAAPREDHTTMTTTTTQTLDAAAGTAPAGTAPAVIELPTVAELAAQVTEHLRLAGQAAVHPLARFASRAHWSAAFQAAYGDPATQQRMAAEFAAVDQITVNNPGVMAPQWRTDIKANLDRRRPAIDLTGGSIPLTTSGLQVNWPYFDGNLDLIITRQLTEKTALGGVRIDIKSANASILTAGVVSDISYQLLMRSSPDYLAAHQSITEAGWARYTEAAFEAALLLIATKVGTLPADPSLDASAKTIKGQIFAMSAAVEDATGAPASGVLVSKDVWLALGGNGALVNSKYGAQNAPGTSDAASLTIDINGLQVRRAPFFPVSTMLATNGDAARFSEQGPLMATQEDVIKLGRDVATWGMYVPAEVYFPAGVVVVKP